MSAPMSAAMVRRRFRPTRRPPSFKPTRKGIRRALWTVPLLLIAGALLDPSLIPPLGPLAAQPELTLVPGFMVEAAAVVPGGAWPGSMHPYYEVDYPAVEAYLKDAPGVLDAHLAAAPETERRDS